MNRTKRTLAFISMILVILLPLQAMAVTIRAPFDGMYAAREYASFDYDDMLFAGKSTKLKPKLAIASVSLAASAHRSACIKDALEQMGFNNIQAYDFNIGEWTAEDNDYVAHTLARKSVSLNGKAFTLYAVAISGTQGYDWISDFLIGEDSEHKGFSIAANSVMKHIAAYVDTPAENNIIWVFGHSRGAAVGNIVGARLNADKLLATPGKVFCYTSATPCTTRKRGLYGSSGNKNIIALNNSADFITCIPLVNWGYSVYGRAITLPNQGKTYKRMLSGFQALSGSAYAGWSVEANRQVLRQIRKYAPSARSYVSAVSFRDAQGVHCPKRYFDGLALVLTGKAEWEQGFSMMLKEIDASGYAVNITALLLGMKLPCTKERLYAKLAALDIKDPVKSMVGVAHAHTLEAYISWVNALYG